MADGYDRVIVGALLIICGLRLAALDDGLAWVADVLVGVLGVLLLARGIATLYESYRQRRQTRDLRTR